jgi:hypothetical protein
VTAAADEIGQRRDCGTAADTEPGAKIVPEGDAEFAAGLGKTEEGVTAVATGVAAGSAADVTLGHLAADVVFRAVGVQRYLRVVEHHQQFGLVGVQPLQQPIEGNEAGLPSEDTVEGAEGPSVRKRTLRKASEGHFGGRGA